MKHPKAHRKSRGKRGNSSKSPSDGVAFSTGQAARYCFVTPDTILNWINGESLKAYRTAGGQYRILAADLHSFMREHQMNTDLLESELHVRPYCWEFHCEGDPSSTCLECIVHRSGAINCFELRSVANPGGRLVETCESCDYYRRYADSIEEE